MPSSLAPPSTLQSLDMHGTKVRMHGYQSGESVGVYNGLPVANIQAEMGEEGIITTVTSLEYSIIGLEGESFSERGDSGAMVSCESETSIGTINVIIGMVVGGFEKERITRFTRVDFLVDDIMEMTEATDIEIPLFL